MIITGLLSSFSPRHSIRFQGLAAALALCILAPRTARPEDLAILSPTEAYPLTVGSAQAPGKSIIELEVRLHGSPVRGLRRGDFTAQIGGKPAGVVTAVELEDRYVLNLLPPAQPAIGLYDLRAQAANTSQTLHNSIRYTSDSQINVDAVLTLDNSGSMDGSGYLEPAKAAASSFVERMRTGDKVGVVSFSDFDRLVYPLTTITPPVDPMSVFSDGGETGTTEWSLIRPPWGTTTDNPHSGTSCWTDSPGTNYVDLQNSSLITRVFSLEGLEHPVLNFWTRYDLEEYPDGGDFGRVFIAVGANTPVELAAYTGYQPEWVPKTIDLTAYAGQTELKIIFNLFSDNIVNYDGWYLDDITIGSDLIGVKSAAQGAIAGIVPEGGTSIGSGLNRAQTQLAGSQAQGGSYCWTDSPASNYEDDTFVSLISPTLNFTGVADPRLEYWASYLLEDTYDFGQIYATKDNGAIWTKLVEFTGSKPAWTPGALDLSAYGGQAAVKIAFSVQTDYTGVYDGLYVDDVWVGSASNRSKIIFQDDMEHGPGAWAPDHDWAIIDTHGEADPSHPWAVILLSDGYENTAPYVSEILPSVLRTKTRVFTIALGPDSDSGLMQDIAAKTGGEFFSAPNATDLGYIYDSLASQVTGYQTLFSEPATIAQGATVEQSALVDSSVTEAIFSINWPSGGNALSLTLVEPGGRVITSATVDPKITFVSAGSGQSYLIKQPVAGDWKFKTFGTAVPAPAAALSPEVLRDRKNWIPAGGGDTRPDRSKAAPPATLADVPQIEFKAVLTGAATLSINGHLYNKEHFVAEPLRILASLSDTAPVLGATVVAKGASPAAPFELALLDDGAHGDGAANDGVYGGSLADTATAGLYAYDIKANGPVGRAFQRIARGSAFLRDADLFELIRRYLLGIDSDPTGLDVSGDGVVDAADLLRAGMQ